MERGVGGGGWVGYLKTPIWEDSTQGPNPYPFNIPFLTEKVPLSSIPLIENGTLFAYIPYMLVYLLHAYLRL